MGAGSGWRGGRGTDPPEGVWQQRGRPVAGSPVAVWAGAQAGLVTRPQCLAAGLGDEALGWRIESGRWRRVHPGVYLTTPGRQGWEVGAVGAFLRAVSVDLDDAALAGDAAGFILGLVSRPPSTIEVVVPGHRRVQEGDGLSVRRTGRFDEVLDPVSYPWRTSVPVTVLDCAGQRSADGALAVVSRAVQRRWTTAGALARELQARRRHPHGALLREVLADIDDGAESAAEVRYVRDVERAHGLPSAVRQQPGRTGPRRVHDNAYDEFGVVVEVDGRLGHEGWSDRIRDGRRDRSAAGEGRFTTRVFWPDVALTPCRTAAEVGAVLAARGWGGSPGPCRRRHCALRAPG
jgi:putative AbiEi antitoxin of type IV toxin-antitoxin system